MEKIINWGILGPGSIAAKFAEGLKFVPGANLYAVGSRSGEKSKEFATKFKVAKWYDSYKSLADDPKIDVIYIATPHTFHCEHALLCLDHGKAVLCEKPFAINEKQVQQMISSAREKKLFLMEALWTKFMPSVIKTIELINSGTIGDIVHVASDFGFRANYNPESRLFNPALGGGSLLDIGIYPVFIALMLLGKPDSIKSEAIIGKTGVDESMSVIFKYNKGQLATLNSTFLARTETITLIHGTKGRIKLNPQWHTPTTLTLWRENSEAETFDFEYKGNGYEYEAMDVNTCLQNGATESSVMTHGFSILLIKTLDTIRSQCGIRYREDEN